MVSVARWKRSCHPKLREQVGRCERLGFTFRLGRSSGHVEGFDPDGVKCWSTGSTPSDWRAQLNARANLRAAVRIWKRESTKT